MAFTYHHRAALDCKRESLQAEARIIKSREQKWVEKARAARNKQQSIPAEKSLWTYYHLRQHRLRVVRPEARAAHLAHAFLKGKPYKSVEQKVHDQTYYDMHYGLPYIIYLDTAKKLFWEKVLGIVNRFSHGTYILAEIEAWRDKP